MPGFPVFRFQQLKFQLAHFIGNRISQDYSVLRIPESYGIKKSFRIIVAELQLPMFAAVAGVINARLFAGASRHKESLVGPESHYPAKIERAGIGNLRCSPVASPIHSAQIRPMSSAGPGDLP